MPPVPAREPERLAALGRMRILDTPPEEAFDRITRLAARLLGMPISLISLLDERRQWFKSRHGLATEWTTRDIAFCAHTIADTEPLIVRDATADPRFKDNPLVTGGPAIRFYAGAPLLTADNLSLGTLCVIDQVPHPEFGREETELLHSLAVMAMERIESRALVAALREESASHEQTAATLRDSLAEREVLLREVHHRVKNTLQAVTAIVQVECSTMPVGSLARDAIERVGRRLAVMAGVHEELYATGDLRKVDLARQIAAVVEGLEGLSPAPERIRISLDLEPSPLESELSMRLALIVNELASNSLKHGFPDGRTGHLRIALRRPAPDRVALTVEDDGVGRPDGAPAAQGVGTLLVQALAGQIGADLRTMTDGGWRTEVDLTIDGA